MQKVILFYKFTPLADPEAVRMWQFDLADALALRGRVIVSPHGINGTLGGEMGALKRYVRRLKEYPGFRGTEIKWSAGGAEDFPRLTVKARDEIVTFGVPDELVVDDGGVVGGGLRLSPGELHRLVAEKPETVFFDGRNRVEASVGRFRGAVVPDVDHTRDFVGELESGKYDHLTDKPVVTYCTGGIRCEVLSALMVNRGFREVYQLDGGVVRYGETFGNGGLWEGSLYVFDRRGVVDFGEGAAVIGVCSVCGDPTRYVGDCADVACKAQLVACRDCTPRCVAHAA
ncbi:rhodanese-related sulfurtransferase [Tessaracoccus oleiagri]|uniref:tRNA uridine(34) hydroxylase n=1 Tax=Tessaracoccus oleiagri TaxID=686624 RepID=A0A1G9MW97_9ACTN|nr:rhodanese-related sulfurtransferase [Tessaracoccus oleiagri]SDL77895.1 UPF0176 protein [Tessaracoccus oleiagri]